MASGDDTILQAWSRLLGAHALALKAIDRSLKAAGLPSMAWYDLLLELDRAGGRRRIGELAESLVIEPYNMTRLLDRLQEAGLLTREKVPGDRRGAVAVLTPEGAALRKRMWPHYQRLILETFGATLSKEDAEALTRMLKGVVDHLRTKP